MVLLLAPQPSHPRSTSPAASTHISDRQRTLELLDKNNNGTLEVEEFVAGSLGRAAANKRVEFQDWDLNADGHMTFAEFRQRGRQSSGEFDPIREFERRDRNLDHVLTLEEFLANRDQGTEPWNERFAQFDQDGDNRVELEEYTATHAGWRRYERWRLVQKWLACGIMVMNVLAAMWFGRRIHLWKRRKCSLLGGPLPSRDSPTSVTSSPRASPPTRLTTARSIDEFEVL